MKYHICHRCNTSCTNTGVVYGNGIYHLNCALILILRDSMGKK